MLSLALRWSAVAFVDHAPKNYQIMQLHRLRASLER